MSNQFKERVQRSKDAREALLGGLGKAETGDSKENGHSKEPKIDPLSETRGQKTQDAPQSPPSQSPQSTLSPDTPSIGGKTAVTHQNGSETLSASLNSGTGSHLQSEGEKTGMNPSGDQYPPYDPSQFDPPIVEPIPYKPRRYKKERLIDTHEQKSYYMEKEIVKIIEMISKGDSGFKYRFINEAVRLLIHQEYPEYAYMLKQK